MQTKHQIINGDCFDLIKTLDDNSIDLVITSPPYLDVIDYGKNVKIHKKEKDYVEWLHNLMVEIERVLKPSGSFILNINDKCINGYKSIMLFDLIANNPTKLKMYDYYIWHKKTGIPNGSQKRFRNTTEFIFHFAKDKNYLKFYMERVLKEPAEGYLSRTKYDVADYQCPINDGVRERKKVKVRHIKKIVDGVPNHTYKEKILPDKVRPDNVFRFDTAAVLRDNTIRHPAPYNKELPGFFITLLTDEGDIVLDPFSGIGTTSIAAKEQNRNSIGFELNESYADFSIQRIDNFNVEK